MILNVLAVLAEHPTQGECLRKPLAFLLVTSSVVVFSDGVEGT